MWTTSILCLLCKQFQITYPRKAEYLCQYVEYTNECNISQFILKVGSAVRSILQKDRMRSPIYSFHVFNFLNSDFSPVYILSLFFFCLLKPINQCIKRYSKGLRKGKWNGGKNAPWTIHDCLVFWNPALIKTNYHNQWKRDYGNTGLKHLKEIQLHVATTSVHEGNPTKLRPISGRPPPKCIDTWSNNQIGNSYFSSPFLWISLEHE